jgi:metal transporter CNNM
MYISSPISFPIAKLLDQLLGQHNKSRFLNNDLKALIELHTFNALEKLNIIEKKNEKDVQQVMSLGKQSQMSSSHTDHLESQIGGLAELGLNQEQANIMISAIDIKEKKAIEIMIPLKNTFMISYDENLDKFKIGLILDKGFSRIPVYTNNDRNDIVGILSIIKEF